MRPTVTQDAIVTGRDGDLGLCLGVPEQILNSLQL
jgi:hypothetical protein